jgi:hypothetical protein
VALTILPDVEAIVSAYLRSHPDVAALVSDRVYTRIPRNPTFPLLRLWRIGGAPVYSTPLMLDAALLQIDAFGGSISQTRTLAATAMAALADLPDGHPNVRGCDFGALASDEDPSYEPPKPRYRFDVTVYARS